MRPLFRKFQEGKFLLENSTENVHSKSTFGCSKIPLRQIQFRSTLMLTYSNICISYCFLRLCLCAAHTIRIKYVSFFLLLLFYFKLLPIYFEKRYACVWQCVKSITSNKTASRTRVRRRRRRMRAHKLKPKVKRSKMGWLLLSIWCNAFFVLVLVLVWCLSLDGLLFSSSHSINRFDSSDMHTRCPFAMCMHFGLCTFWEIDMIRFIDIPLICVFSQNGECEWVRIVCRSLVKTFGPRTGFHMSFNRRLAFIANFQPNGFSALSFLVWMWLCLLLIFGVWNVCQFRNWQ